MENSKKGLQNYWSLLQCMLRKQRQLTASTGSVISPITDLKMQILEPNPPFEAELLEWGSDQLFTAQNHVSVSFAHTKNGFH